MQSRLGVETFIIVFSRSGAISKVALAARNDGNADYKPEANVARLESQVIRYKAAAESSEKAEDELKTEKRKLQRELREAQQRVEELETNNTHLVRRLDKLKNAKSTLLKEL